MAKIDVFGDKTNSHHSGYRSFCPSFASLLWALTWVDKFESFPGALWVAVKLQPQVVRGGDQRQSQHGRACECSQDVGCVVFAVINLEIKAAQCTTLERRQHSAPLVMIQFCDALRSFLLLFFFPRQMWANLQYVALGKMKRSGRDVDALSGLHLKKTSWILLYISTLI